MTGQKSVFVFNFNFLFYLLLVDSGSAFFDEHIPECAKPGIHTGAKLGKCDVIYDRPRKIFVTLSISEKVFLRTNSD